MRRVHKIPRHCDPVADCARAVVAHCKNTLPDLRRAVVLMPHHFQFRRLRGCILEQARAFGHDAVLPPVTVTFRTLFDERAPCEQPDLSDHERKLLLATALYEHPDLFPDAGRWEFTDQLLQLFDEIADNEPQDCPPTSSLDLSEDATGLVLTLYHAWRRDRARTPDTPTLRRNNLRDGTLTHPGEHIFLCGFNEMSRREIEWAAQLYRQERLTLITCVGDNGRYATPALDTIRAIAGNTPAPAETDDALSQLLTAAFASGNTITARARAVSERFATSSAVERISVFRPESTEQHAFGIYLKIRDWLDAGISPVSVVSQDRKLTRRIRAVLERASIPLYDHSGWALSTTASATTVSALLPPAEQGFDSGVLLTLARSPYCGYSLDVIRTQTACAQLERAFTKLEPFRNLDESIAGLLSIGDGALGTDAKQIIGRIRDALAGLRQAMQKPMPALFDALFDTMNTLGITPLPENDAAGEHLLQELKAMAAASHAQNTGNWNLWRRWILHTFEHENFVPKEHGYLVELCNLRQSALARPAGMIIAALDSAHTLPAEPMPLLDESRRRELGLKDRSWRTAVQFNHLRNALESTDRILLTCQRGSNGQMLTPSPWLEGLQHFHALAYNGNELEEPDLLQRAQAEIRSSASARPPAQLPTPPQMPVPKLPAWPAYVGVGDIQGAITCPYRFFAKASLKLRPAPETDDYDSARNYGMHLHRCLAALHTKDEQLPGPMDKPWTEANRSEALKLACEIVEAEFSPYVDRHYSAVERRDKALDAVRWYVVWLIEKLKAENATEVRFETETMQKITLAGEIELRGRPDCVLHTDAGVHILDYKSGSAPSKAAMTSGENIQLTAYALFYGDTRAVSYIKMKERKQETLEGETLDEVRESLRQRIKTFKRDTSDQPLPAWTSEDGCKYCAYPGVCRRDAWHKHLPVK